MFKTFLYGFLIGIIITGLGWFSLGRNDLGQIRKDYNRTSGDLERVQRIVGKLSDNSNGFAGDIAGLTEKSRSIADRGGRLDEGLSGISSNVGVISGKVDNLEKWNRRTVVLSRDFGDQLYELRQINKESRN